MEPSLVACCLQLTCIATLLRFGAQAYSFGGPASICADPYPHHGVPAVTGSDCPFTLVVSPTSYSAGDNITVSIQLKPGAPPGSVFKGFQIAAHPLQGKWHDLQGQFITKPPTTKLGYFYSSKANCITHSSNVERTNLTIVWQSPLSSVGDLIISATVLRDYSTFWVNVSAVLPSNQPYGNSTLAAPLQIATPNDVPHLDGCGLSKTCLLWPRTCSDPNDCDAVVAYSSAGAGYVRFQMSGLTPGYLSLGLSLDTKMDNDETLTCLVAPNGQLMFQRGYNPAYYNQRTTEDLVINVSMQYTNGKLFCDFVRPTFAYVNMTLSRSTVLYPFDLSTAGKYYLYLAWGRLYPGSYDSMMVHDQLPVVSPDKMNMSNPRKYYFNSLPVEFQMHITLMLIAWLGLSSVATIVARYFRGNVFGKIKIDGEVAWLQVHRGMTFAAVPLTIAGFILAFVYLRGWSTAASVHAGFGVAVMALTLLQSTTALCRPRPTSNKRKAFGWFHRVVGLASWVCAATCMILGVNIVYLPPRMIVWGTAVVATWIVVQFVFGLALELLTCCPTPKPNETYAGDMTVEEKEGTAQQQQQQQQQPKLRPIGSRSKSVILTVYLALITSLLAAGLSFTWAY